MRARIFGSAAANAGIRSYLVSSRVGAPVRVIAVLLAAARVAAGRLQVAARIGADPDVGPRRRHRQPGDPLQLRRMAESGGRLAGEYLKPSDDVVRRMPGRSSDDVAQPCGPCRIDRIDMSSPLSMHLRPGMSKRAARPYRSVISRTLRWNVKYAPRPLQHHDEPIAKTDEHEDVEEQPRPATPAVPRSAAGRDRRWPSRGRRSPCCRGLDRRTARVDSPRAGAGCCAPRGGACCIATCATPGSGCAVLMHEGRRIADDEHLRMTGNRQIRLARARVRRDPAARRAWHAAATRHARGPEHRARHRAAPAPSHHAMRVARRVTVASVRAPRRRSRDSASRAASRSFSGNVARIVGPASTRTMRARRRVDGAEFVAQRLARDLRERARQLDAGRAAADQHERQQLALPRGSRLALGALEGQQHATAHLERVLERLQSRRMRLPLGVTEVRVARAGADDQEVVVERRRRRTARRRRRSTSMRADLAEQHADVARAAEHPADRRGDVARRQRRRRHLIEQRLKDVVIAPVEQRDAASRVFAKHPARRQARRTRRR